MVYKWWNSVLDWIYPPVCLVCGWPGIDPALGLCPGCHAELPGNRFACRRCAQPLAPGAPDRDCGRCQRRPPAQARALVPWRYEPPLDFLLQALKYQGQLAVARGLGAALAGRLGEAARWPDCLVPVPLHPARQKRRGFNQAAEIGRALAAALGCALRTDGFRRSRDTPPQAGLDASARRRNLRHAFQADPACFAGRRVVLVDDVITTGSTVHACARALLDQGGAAEVRVWAAARA